MLCMNTASHLCVFSCAYVIGTTYTWMLFHMLRKNIASFHLCAYHGHSVTNLIWVHRYSVFCFWDVISSGTGSVFISPFSDPSSQLHVGSQRRAGGLLLVQAHCGHSPHKKESTWRCQSLASIYAAAPPDWRRVPHVPLKSVGNLGPLGPDLSSSPGYRTAGQWELPHPPSPCSCVAVGALKGHMTEKVGRTVLVKRKLQTFR